MIDKNLVIYNLINLLLIPVDCRYRYFVGLYSTTSLVLCGLPTTPCGLAAGGGIGEVRTRANVDVTCSVSDETAPPLA